MVNVVANSVVPKITVFVGNSYGAGNYAMCGKAYGARFIFAWPSASIAVMGGEQAARRRCSRSSSRTGATRSQRGERRPHVSPTSRTATSAAMDPRYAAARLWVDGILDPRRTREVVARGLAAAAHRAEIPPFHWSACCRPDGAFVVPRSRTVKAANHGAPAAYPRGGGGGRERGRRVLQKQVATGHGADRSGGTGTPASRGLRVPASS